MKMKYMAGKQRGVSLVGMVVIATGIVFAAILGMKVVPAYVHSAQIAGILKSIANDPEMRDASIMQIKSAYGKRADINSISDISGDDIEISKSDGKLSLSTNYTVSIPLVGNVTLLLEFNPSSS